MKYSVLSIKKLSFVLILYSLYSILYSKPIFAQTKPTQILRISPIILNISLSPGKTYRHEVELENMLDIPLPIQAVLDRFDSQDEDGGYTFGSGDAPLVTWTSVEPREFIIPAHDKRTTTVTIQLPDKIPIGGYYAIIFFEPLFPNLQNSPTQVQTKIGLPILANIGVAPTKGPKGEILDFSFDKFLYERGPLQMSLRVKNTSLYHFSAKPFLLIRPLFGQTIRREIEEKIILPNKIRRWSNTIQFEKIGFYTATMLVSTGQEDTIIKRRYFICFPFMQSVIFAATILALLFMIKKGHNLKKALKSFFAKPPS